MTTVVAERQAANVTPPEKDKILVLTLDGSSRRYDLGAVDIGGYTVGKGGYLYIDLYGTVKFYYFMSETDAGTADETAAVAAGGTPVFTANACWEVGATTTESIRVDRQRHRWLVVKGSAAGLLRIRASSDPYPIGGG